MRTLPSLRFLFFFLTAYYLLPTAYSFPDEPTVSYIFPAGGQRGTTVQFRVGGHYLHERCPFEMLGPGITAERELVRAEQTLWFEGPLIPLPDSQQQEDYPHDQLGSLTIAADAPLGFRRWRVWTAQGATASRLFVIGDLPEIVEEEIDGEPIPTAVTLPVTINGRMFPREDIDAWTFAGQAGQSYTCEVMAARMGSPLDSRLVVLDPAGRPLAENVDGRGADSFVRFTAPVDGTYQVRIHDVQFGGLQHYVYRLTITAGPYVQHVFPLGGRGGTTVQFKLVGQELPAEPQAIALPAESRILSHQMNLDGQRSNVFAIDVSDCVELLERAENDVAELPTVLNGAISSPGEVDAWRITGVKDQTLEFEVRAAALNSRLDSVLSVCDEVGQELATNDDVAKGNADSRLAFKFPADGRYSVRIRDRFTSRSGPQMAYRIYVTPVPSVPAPDFALHLPTDALTVPRGGQAQLKLKVDRRGFSGSIALEVAGLPTGVTVENGSIPENKNEVELQFKADNTAKIQASRVTIQGTAQAGGQTMQQRALPPAGAPDDVVIDHLLLAVAMPTPFKVVGAFESRYAARGSTFLRHYTIDRGSYDGPITVSMAERQVRHLQGVTGPTIIVPPGASEFDYPIQLPPWMEIGRTSRTAVMAIGHVADADGAKHPVSYTSHAQNDQIIVLVDPGQMSVRLGRRSIRPIPGTVVELPVEVSVGQGLAGPVQLELIHASHMRGVSAAPLVVPSGSGQATLKIAFAEGDLLGPFNAPLVVRATAKVNGYAYTAEEKLRVTGP